MKARSLTLFSTAQGEVTNQFTQHSCGARHFVMRLLCQPTLTHQSRPAHRRPTSHTHTPVRGYPAARRLRLHPSGAHTQISTEGRTVSPACRTLRRCSPSPGAPSTSCRRRPRFLHDRRRHGTLPPPRPPPRRHRLHRGRAPFHRRPWPRPPRPQPPQRAARRRGGGRQRRRRARGRHGGGGGSGSGAPRRGGGGGGAVGPTDGGTAADAGAAAPGAAPAASGAGALAAEPGARPSQLPPPPLLLLPPPPRGPAPHQ